MDTQAEIDRDIINAVAAHHGEMAEVELEHFLIAEDFGRLRERGLLRSEHFGVLSDVPRELVQDRIYALRRAGQLIPVGGFRRALAVAEIPRPYEDDPTGDIPF